MLIKDDYTIECLKSYFPAASQARLVSPLEIDPQELISLAVQASEVDALGIADCLKIGVEHSADGDADLAFQLADTIIAIGYAREEDSLVGLGTMAQGDTLAHSGRILEGWDRLGEAGDIYRQAGDEVGWARTQIGRLWISPELNQSRVEEAFEDAREAEQIFRKADRHDRLLRLYHNWAFAYGLMGRYEEAISYYQKGVATVEQQGSIPNSDIMIAYLYSDMGNAYNYLGDLRTAMDYLTRARRVLLETQQEFTAAMTGFGMANNHLIRGEYRQSLDLLLNKVLPNISGFRVDMARLTIVDCYLALNRNHEAYELAQDIVQKAQADPNQMHKTAQAALLLATAQTRLGYLAAAQQSLDLAETNFKTYESMVALIQLKRGQLALRQGNFDTAHEIAHKTAEQFHMWQQPMNWIDALLLEAEASLLAKDLNNAQALGQQALRHAQQQGLPPACYRSCVVLGQVLEGKGRRASSIRMYQAALAVLRDIQRSLTISLRAGFVEDKLLPFRHLMRLYLTGSQVGEAFHTLEQLKSQVFLDYLSQRELLHWVENEQTRPLLDELRGLRDKYRWLTRLHSGAPILEEVAIPWYREVEAHTSLQPVIADCEKRLRQITEQLYLHTQTELPESVTAPHLETIQDALDDDTLLIEFYADGEQGWCIAATNDSAACYPLAGSMAEAQTLIEDKWLSNLDFALEIGPEHRQAQALTDKAKRMGEKLYDLLLKPVSELLTTIKHLVIVPYGFAHQLPFNILRHEGHYLIETHEIVILPSASLLLRPTLARESGAVVAANSWDGRLSYSITEGEMVHRWMGGEIFLEQEANHGLLQYTPRKVLHISTHGEHRIDQPDFAYVELGDGPVYTDDLLQCDLSYELVVLSACEVGRANVAGGDELIGLGRGFLYAGAGALITSLWRVNERHTYQLMECLYRALCQGVSKAAALRAAQRELLAQNVHLHPAFWAAFQLVGNAEPLGNVS